MRNNAVMIIIMSKPIIFDVILVNSGQAERKKRERFRSNMFLFPTFLPKFHGRMILSSSTNYYYTD